MGNRPPGPLYYRLRGGAVAIDLAWDGVVAASGTSGDGNYRVDVPSGLRPFAGDDVEELMTWVTSPAELVAWAGRSLAWPLDPARLAALARPRGADLAWSATDSETGALVGHVGLAQVDTVHRSGRLSRVLVAPPARRGGVGRAMVVAALTVAFGELALHRVALGVYAHNERALRLYRGLGFVEEGRSRHAALVDGSWWDSVEMGLLETEWRP